MDNFSYFLIAHLPSFCSDYKTGEEGKKEGKNQNNEHFNLRTSRLRS